MFCSFCFLMLPLLEVSPVRLPGAVDELLNLNGKLRGVLDAVRVPVLSDCYLNTVLSVSHLYGCQAPSTSSWICTANSAASLMR